MSSIHDGFDRLWLSLSVMELRQSEHIGEAGRLPYNSVLYLDIILFNPGCTITQIAEMLGVTKATVTITVNRLEQKGMVVRRRSESDGRVRHLYVSDNLKDAYRTAEEIIGWVGDRLSENHSESEMDCFVSMLNEAAELFDSCKGLEAPESDHKDSL